jgi:osmotically-inducible protein OsmY
MVRTPRVGTASAVALLLLAAGWASAQDAPKTTTEVLKEKASSAVSSVKKGVGSATDAIKNKYNAAKDHVKAMEIEARVYARLHWDKALAGHKVELSAPRAGSIVLTGTVADAKAKSKAVELTSDTVGVTEVVDHLTIQTTATVADPAK